MTVSIHELTILCLIEQTDDVDSLAAIADAAIHKRNVLERSPKSVERKLYSWAWIGGGFNQTYADTEAEAIKYAHEMCSTGPGKVLVPNMATFKIEENVNKYWNDIPLMD